MKRKTRAYLWVHEAEVLLPVLHRREVAWQRRQLALHEVPEGLVTRRQRLAVPAGQDPQKLGISRMTGGQSLK